MKKKLIVLFLFFTGSYAPLFAAKISVGGNFAYNPHENIIAENGWQQMGGSSTENDHFGRLFSFGLKGKIDFDHIGARVGLLYNFTFEQEIVDPAGTEKWNFDNFMVPLSGVINIVSTDKVNFFMGTGFGFAYQSYEVNTGGPGGQETTESSSFFDWNFIIGCDVFLSPKFSFSIEYLVVRGGDDEAERSIANNITKHSVTHNMELILLGVSVHF